MGWRPFAWWRGQQTSGDPIGKSVPLECPTPVRDKGRGEQAQVEGPRAAGIDTGGASHRVAIDSARCDRAVREFALCGLAAPWRERRARGESELQWRASVTSVAYANS